MLKRIGFLHFVEGWHRPVEALVTALNAAQWGYGDDVHQSLIVLPIQCWKTIFSGWPAEIRCVPHSMRTLSDCRATQNLHCRRNLGTSVQFGVLGLRLRVAFDLSENVPGLYGANTSPVGETATIKTHSFTVIPHV